MNNEIFLLVIGAVVAAILLFLLFRASTRLRSFSRLPHAAEPAQSRTAPDAQRPFQARAFPRRHRLLPWALALVVLLALLYFHLSAVYATAIALMVGLLAGQAESSRAEQQLILIETQLADAIDLMVSTLHAGGGLMVAIENAAREVHSPLRRYLLELLARIRYGEEPQTVVRRLSTHIPIESFRLFTTALAVHWEVGGSLAPPLATVGRTVRDRIDIARRIRSLTAQARVSTIILLVVTYFLALLMWRHDPMRVTGFLASRIGRALVSASLVLQAVGIVWQSALSKPKF